MAAALGAVAVLAALGACGGMPPRVGKSGLDGLTIPTPSPRPRDFVEGLDQRWFAPGGRQIWTFATGSAAAGTSAVVTIEIDDDPRTIDGIATTPVTTTERAGGRRTRQTDWYAQDRPGNVWWFGHQGQSGTGGADWEAGRDGYQAGVVVPALPRTGDGFVTAQREDDPVSVAEVLDINVEVEVPAGEYDATAIRLRDPATGMTETRYYADGVGLVYRTSGAGEWGLSR